MTLRQFVHAKRDHRISEEREAAKLIFMSRVPEFEQGEKSTRYFFRVAMRNYSKSNIFKQNIDGNEITDSKLIMQKLQSHFENLFKEDKVISGRVRNCPPGEFLYKDIKIDPHRILTDQERDSLEKDVTFAEVENIVKKHISTGKSPGNDGLTAAFYKHHWDEIKDIYFSAL